jgi:hypothetical protein
MAKGSLSAIGNPKELLNRGRITIGTLRQKTKRIKDGINITTVWYAWWNRAIFLNSNFGKQRKQVIWAQAVKSAINRTTMKKPSLTILWIAVLFFAAACSNDKDQTTKIEPIPEVFQKIYNVEEIYVDGDFLFIRTKDLPDHGSPFYPETDPRYEEYNGTNPNFSTSIYIDSLADLIDTIIDPDLLEQDITMRIPLHPEEALNKEFTPLYAIGIALNGVPFYNQYNGAWDLLDSVETNNLDQYNGHPTPTFAGAGYHYHEEPLFLTANNGRSSLVGFLLDGFPVYGPIENGVELVSADLDEYHGHFGVTTDYPDGIYHYHVTADAPWINGDGFYGVRGTVSN